jgi:hypothetical protein
MFIDWLYGEIVGIIIDVLVIFTSLEKLPVPFIRCVKLTVPYLFAIDMKGPLPLILKKFMLVLISFTFPVKLSVMGVDSRVNPRVDEIFVKLLFVI